MDNQKEFLDNDSDGNITYFLIHLGATIDSILSEPHNKAILSPQNISKEMDRNSGYQDIMEVRNGRFR